MGGQESRRLFQLYHDEEWQCHIDGLCNCKYFVSDVYKKCGLPKAACAVPLLATTVQSTVC